MLAMDGKMLRKNALAFFSRSAHNLFSVCIFQIGSRLEGGRKKRFCAPEKREEFEKAFGKLLFSNVKASSFSFLGNVFGDSSMCL